MILERGRDPIEGQVTALAVATRVDRHQRPPRPRRKKLQIDHRVIHAGCHGLRVDKPWFTRESTAEIPVELEINCSLQTFSLVPVCVRLSLKHYKGSIFA